MNELRQQYIELFGEAAWIEYAKGGWSQPNEDEVRLAVKIEEPLTWRYEEGEENEEVYDGGVLYIGNKKFYTFG